MGVLTEAMTRLRGEIGAWRHKRVFLQSDLVRQTEERRTRTSALRAVFARDRAGAHRAWFGPTLSERRAAEMHQQQLAAQAQREHEQQRRAEEAKAQTQREHEHRQQLAEEAHARTQREQPSPAAVKSRPQEHNPAKPVPETAARPSVAPLAQAQRPSLKGSKKH
jgi:hypothetical protein